MGNLGRKNRKLKMGEMDVENGEEVFLERWANMDIQ